MSNASFVHLFTRARITHICQNLERLALCRPPPTPLRLIHPDRCFSSPLRALPTLALEDSKAPTELLDSFPFTRRELGDWQ